MKYKSKYRKAADSCNFSKTARL